MVDYPHSTRAKKFFLVLMVGQAVGAMPAAKGLDGAEPMEEDVDGAAGGSVQVGAGARAKGGERWGRREGAGGTRGGPGGGGRRAQELGKVRAPPRACFTGILRYMGTSVAGVTGTYLPLMRGPVAGCRSGMSGTSECEVVLGTRAMCMAQARWCCCSCCCSRCWRGWPTADPPGGPHTPHPSQVAGRQRHQKGAGRKGGKGGKGAGKGRGWVLKKKEQMRHKGYAAIKPDTKYTGRKRRHLV